MPAADYDLIVAHLVRDINLLEQAQMAGLSPEDFDKSKLRHYKFVWSAALSYFLSHHETIPRAILERESGLEMAKEELVTERLTKKVQELIQYIYAFKREELASDYIRDNLLQVMIDELKLSPRLQEMATETDVSRLSDMFLENQRVYDQTRVVVNKSADLFSPEGRQQHTEDKLPENTGIDFIDILTGGLRPGSLVGIMAESSGGKTMIGTQFVCEQAMKKRPVCAFYYEQSLAGDIAERFYSYLSGTPREELKDKAHDEYPEATRKHLDAIQAKMQEFCYVYDMSGAVRGQGNGGPDEIEAIVGRMVRNGVEPKTMVVDWLGPMVTKYYNLPKHIRPSDKRDKIELVINRLKEVTERWGVSIVVLHQIAAHIMEGKTPHFQPDWTVAAEYKSFGFLMDYVMTFGKRCEKTNCMWFNTPKARGAPRRHRIVRMDAEYNKIVDAESRDSGVPYSVNPMADRDKVYFTRKSDKKKLPPSGAL